VPVREGAAALIRLIGFDRRPTNSVERIVNCSSTCSGITSPCFAAKQHRSAKLKLRSRETVGNRHARRLPPADATT
jgi:hypothetical protein